jgi:hypothetical protein
MGAAMSADTRNIVQATEERTMSNGTNITINAPVTEVSISHSLKCPLGGGFWI